jgi:hypothetical protein
MLIAILLAPGSVVLPGGEGGIGFDDIGFGRNRARSSLRPGEPASSI